MGVISVPEQASIAHWAKHTQPQCWAALAICLEGKGKVTGQQKPCVLQSILDHETHI